MKVRPAILAFAMAASLGLGDSVRAEDDALKGEEYFKRCLPCHSLSEGVHKSGPSLYDIIGRRAGTVEGFNYSGDLKEAGKKGLVWNHQTIHDYLGDPKGFLADFLGKRNSRTKMKLRYRDHDFRHGVITHLENNGKNNR